jgi:hypothetical protein
LRSVVTIMLNRQRLQFTAELGDNKIEP